MPPDIVPERPFDEPWQAQAFAMAVALNERGLFGWDEWAAALSQALADEPERPYWRSWLTALERLAAAKGVTDAATLKARAVAWREAADATPHGAPIVLP